MQLTLNDIAIIETIIRQQWYSEDDSKQRAFESWLMVDQEQALALLERIPGRLPSSPKPLPMHPETEDA